MSKILVAVGGSGQEIALACLRLSHMAGLTPPTVLVLDSDQSPALRGVQTRTQALQELNAFLGKIEGTKREVVRFLSPFTTDGAARGRVTTLSSMLAPAGVPHPQAVPLTSALLVEEQLQTRITDGFHGEPAVGAIAVGDYMGSAGFKEDFEKVVDTATKDARSDHFVVLAGATSGGTGPGTIPPLSRQLMTWRTACRPPRSIQISGLLQLPWFSLVETDPDTPWVREADVDVTVLQRNSACLVRHYHAGLPQMMDRVVVVSLPALVQRLSAGPNHQPETLHWLNVLCGWMACELLCAGPTLDAVKAQSLYGYALQTNDSLLSLTFNETGQARSLRRAITATRVMAAYGRALEAQLGPEGLDPSLPKATWRFLRALRQQGPQAVAEFLRAFRELCDWEERMRAWLVAACASRLRPNDPRSPDQGGAVPGSVRAFATAADRVEADEAFGLLRQRPLFVHDGVAMLLRAAGATVEKENPGATALNLYRNLRSKLMTELVMS